MLIMYGDDILAAGTNLQKYVSLRSNKAEYAAIKKIVRAGLRLRNVLNELNVEQGASKIFQDSSNWLETRR